MHELSRTPSGSRACAIGTTQRTETQSTNARRRTRFSRSSALSPSRSALVSPDSRSLSRSACQTHWRNVSHVQPIFSAIDQIAVHYDMCLVVPEQRAHRSFPHLRGVLILRTHRSRLSCLILSEIPGTVQVRVDRQTKFTRNRTEQARGGQNKFLITYEPHVPGSTPAREPDSGH